MKCLSMFLGALVGNHGSWFTQRFTCVIKRLAFSYLISEASWEGVFSNPATQIICFHTLIRHHRENVPRTCCRSKIPVAYPTRTVTHTDTHTKLPWLIRTATNQQIIQQNHAQILGLVVQNAIAVYACQSVHILRSRIHLKHLIVPIVVLGLADSMIQRNARQKKHVVKQMV